MESASQKQKVILLLCLCSPSTVDQKKEQESVREGEIVERNSLEQIHVFFWLRDFR